MTIRGRVTLWYAVVLFLVLLLTVGGVYYELAYEPRHLPARDEKQDPLEVEVGEVFIFFIVPGILVTVIGGWWLLRRSLVPLDALTRAAERIDAENLREPLPRSGNGDEVDRLSQVLNAMNQRISEAMREIHEFTLHASHELKTPLTILHSEIETAMGSGAATPAQRESMASQLDEIQRLTRIVEALGLLARANSGQMPLAQEPVALHEIVKDTAEDAIILGRARRLVVEAPSIEPAWVLGDRHRLRQILLNLAENACKYNKENGAIRLSLRVAETRVLFEIANTGPGIPPEELPHLFKRFYRGTGRHAVDPGGVGLGLSIAQSIAKAHRGEISVQSTPGGWTTVRVDLPRIQPPMS